MSLCFSSKFRMGGLFKCVFEGETQIAPWEDMSSLERPKNSDSLSVHVTSVHVDRSVGFQTYSPGIFQVEILAL